MRILHLTNHCRFGHGNVHAAVDLACAQKKAGHAVFFASNGGDFEQLLADHGVLHFRLDQENRSPRSLAAGALQLRKAIRENKIDIVHAHMMTGAVIGFAATRLGSTRLIATVHNAFDSHSILMSLADRVIAVSNAVAEHFALKGVSRKKLRTVMNGTLGAARRAGLSQSPAALKRPSITTVCGLHHRKGVPDLLRAFDLVSRHNPDATLYVIGEGPSENEYAEQARSLLHGDRVHFLGQLRDPNPQLLSSDIFILASHQDPCPLVIPEAREAGCAIVASDVDGIPEMLRIGGAGVLFPPRDHTAIAAALLKLLDDPKALADCKAASGIGLDHFSIDRVCEETSAVYAEALSRRAAAI